MGSRSRSRWAGAGAGPGGLLVLALCALGASTAVGQEGGDPLAAALDDGEEDPEQAEAPPPGDDGAPQVDVAEEGEARGEAGAGEPAAVVDDTGGAADEGAAEEGPVEVPREDASDALFLGGAAALGSFAGVGAIGMTSVSVAYTLLQVSRWFDSRTLARYWWVGLFGLVPVVISVACIPAGAAFGTWWGAGLRGLPLPLVDATGTMLLGLFLGGATGVLFFGPLGVMATSLVGAAFLAANLGPILAGGPTATWAAFGVGLVGGPLVVGGLLGGLGGLGGAAVGPVLTASRWGRTARASHLDEE